jgi:uncharacterized protein (DUF983 family)
VSGNDATGIACGVTDTANPAAAARYLLRALGLRCPICGGRGLWATYFRMREHCPTCGLHLERGEAGYIVGAATFNIIVAELGFMAVFIGVLLATWPTPPWPLLQWGGLALMVVMPILFYPFSKTTFLAFDLIFRPRGYDQAEGGDPKT